MIEIQELTRKKNKSSLAALRDRLQSALSDQRRNAWWVMGGVIALATIALMVYLYVALQNNVWQYYGLVGAALLLIVACVAGILLSRRGQTIRGIWLMLFLGVVALAISPLFVANVGIWYAGVIVLSTLVVSTLCLPSRQGNWANLLGVLGGIGALLSDSFLDVFQVASPALLLYLLYFLMGFMAVGYLFTLVVFFTTFDLRAKITVTMFSTAVLSIIAVSVINNITTRRELVSAVNQTLLVAANYTARNVDEYLDEIALQMGMDALSPYLSDHLALLEEEQIEQQQTASIFMLSLRSRTGAQQYVLLDRSGKVVLHTQYSNHADVAQLPVYLGLSDADRNTFLISVLSGVPFYSSVIFPDQGEPYFYVGQRILDADKKPAGLLMASYPLAAVQTLVRESKGLAGEGSYGVLLSGDYLRIAQSGSQEGLYQLVVPLSDAEMEKMKASHDLPNRPLEELATDFPEFKAGLDNITSTPFFASREVGTGDDVNSMAVLRLESQGWLMVFMQPQSIILRPVEDQTRTIVLFASIIAGLTVLTATGLAQLLSRPIVRLTGVAEKAAAGDWSQEAEAQGQDEIGKLANAFNIMTGQLRQTFEELETRVDQRTAELAHTSEQMEYRAQRLQKVAEVTHVIAAEQNPDKLLTLATQTISEQFDYYHVGVFLLDKDEEYAVLQAANSAGGQRMLARGHRLKVGEVGIVGYVTKKGQPRIALDVGEDAVFFDNPDLPQTRSEIALPLKIGSRVIGALDVQSTESGAFSGDDTALLSTLADQVAMAIQNARLFGETQRALRELQTAQRQYIRQEWMSMAAEKPQTGYQYLFGNLQPVGSAAVQTLEAGDDEARMIRLEAGEEPLEIPISLRGQVIGNIQMGGPEDLRNWSEEEIQLAQAVADQVGLALENARLLEVTQRRAERERTVAEITTKLRATNDPQAILDAAVSELRTALRAKTVRVSIQKKDGS